MRIAVGGFHHETNTFAPTKASFEMFRRADGWPGLCRGGAVLADTAGINLPIAGFLEAARASGRDFAPLVWANASPSAEVEEEAFERIAGMMVDDLRDAGPVDAVYLDLHGAMVAEHLEDGEGELLRRVRAVIGPGIPLVASLDLHANVSPLMADRADALTVFRTYPHVDMAETGARTARLLERILAEGRPAKGFRQVPFLIPLTAQCTLVEPAAGLYAGLAGRERGAVRSVSLAGGFPLADTPDCGPAALAYAADERSAADAAEALAEAVLAARGRFDAAFLSPEEAVARADRAGRAGRPVVIADSCDNPGGGGDGDTTGLLRALAAARPEGAVLGLLIDGQAAAAAHEAGEGGRLALALGGRSGIPGDGPFETDAIVRRLGDGSFTCTGPFYGGNRMQLGPMALLELPGGVQVVVASRKVQAADREMFRHLGVEPADCRILALKSSVHFRADFGPIAGEVLIAAAPGPVAADPGALAFTRLRPGVAQRP